MTKAQYAILRFAKQKGGSCRALEAHHERQKENYASNPDIDIERSKNNFHIIQPKQHYKQEVDERIIAAGCRTRKDSTKFVDTLITASPSFFKNKKTSEIKDFFQSSVDFLSDKIGTGNIFSAVVHMDEKTPHLHLCFTPITPDGRLSAKDILGNRAQLSKWQDDFYSCMVKKYPDLERGEPSRVTGRRHIPTRIFKQAVVLSKQATMIKKELSDITPLNAKKKQANALAMLQKWFPQMEDFAGQLKKYQRTINYLADENVILTEKAATKSENKIRNQLEIAKLQREIKSLNKFIDSIPNEVKDKVKKTQRQEKLQKQNRRQEL